MSILQTTIKYFLNFKIMPKVNIYPLKQLNIIKRNNTNQNGSQEPN